MTPTAASKISANVSMVHLQKTGAERQGGFAPRPGLDPEDHRMTFTGT